MEKKRKNALNYLSFCVSPINYHLQPIINLYSPFQLSKKYLRYYLSASNGKGHGIHSPFVFDFIKNVLTDKKTYPSYQKIEAIRAALKSDKTIIEVYDFGAGSNSLRSNKRVIKDIANSSLKPKKYAQLLYRMVQYYKPATILELGTSLGITAAYLASANKNAKVFTCEGAQNIAAIAQNNFDQISIDNIRMVTGDFAKTLAPLLSDLKKIDFAFIDGNHRKIPTLDYFHLLLAHSGKNTILVFDDVHWSLEMEHAWAAIQQHEAVTLTIDLFFIGIVFINKDFKVRQHFTIAY